MLISVKENFSKYQARLAIKLGWLLLGGVPCNMFEAITE